MNLEVRVTPIQFANGQLISQHTIWIGNDNTPATLNKRTRLEIISPDVPTKSPEKSIIDTSTNQYIQFDATSPYKDVRT